MTGTPEERGRARARADFVQSLADLEREISYVENHPPVDEPHLAALRFSLERNLAVVEGPTS